MHRIAETSAVSIARACIRNGRRGRVFNVVDPVQKNRTPEAAQTASAGPPV
jgi:hypothetical protein